MCHERFHGFFARSCQLPDDCRARLACSTTCLAKPLLGLATADFGAKARRASPCARLDPETVGTARTDAGAIPGVGLVDLSSCPAELRRDNAWADQERPSDQSG